MLLVLPPATVGQLRPFAEYRNLHPNTSRYRYSPVTQLTAGYSSCPEFGTSQNETAMLVCEISIEHLYYTITNSCQITETWHRSRVYRCIQKKKWQIYDICQADIGFNIGNSTAVFYNYSEFQLNSCQPRLNTGNGCQNVGTKIWHWNHVFEFKTVVVRYSPISPC